MRELGEGDEEGRARLDVRRAGAGERRLGREDVEFPAGFGELEQSVLKEVANILVGAYLSALSEFLGMVLIMSVPALAIDQAGAGRRHEGE